MNLEPSSAEIASILDAVKARLLIFLDNLAAVPASEMSTGDQQAGALSPQLPSGPMPLEELLTHVFDKIVPHGANTMHPGYFAYIPSGGITIAAIAQLLADAVNRYTTVWQTAPALAKLESIVIGWFGEILGYQPPFTGFLTTGTSMATLSALLAARDQYVSNNFLRGTIYVSDQAHNSVQKAARIIGIPSDNVREVPSDKLFRMSIPALEQLIDHDRQAGLLPFALVGTAGTTNTGAVDDLDALSRIAEQQRLWFHVDAAYGGFFMLTEQGKNRLMGIADADSIAVDPHKALCFPYGTGALLCHHETALRTAHSTTGAYMPNVKDAFDLCQLSPELTRDARGLKVWFPLKLLGFDPFRANLEEKLAMIRLATDELRQIKSIEIIAEPQLTIVAFRLKPADENDLGKLNELNEDLLKLINETKRVYLSRTKIHGVVMLRICALSCRSHEANIRECVAIVRDGANRLLSRGSPGTQPARLP